MSVSLKIINADGAFEGPGITPVTIVPAGGVVEPLASGTFVIINADGAYTFVRPFFTAFSSTIGTVGKPQHDEDSSGLVNIISLVNTRGKPTHTAVITINVTGSVGAIGKPQHAANIKNGNETYFDGRVGSIGMPSSVVTTDNILVQEVSVISTVNAVGEVSSVVTRIEHTLDSFTSIINAIGTPRAVVVYDSVTETMCYITMTLTDIDGNPVGQPSIDLVDNGTNWILTNTWEGVKVSASILSAKTVDGKVAVTDRITQMTDEKGFTRFRVYQGLSVRISYSGLGAPVTVDTTGHTTIDLSSVIA
jgi:hypothetical protein